MRITSLGGNVIAADFCTRAPAAPLAIEFKTQVLFADPFFCVIRIGYFMGGELLGIQHITAEMPQAAPRPPAAS